MSKPLTGKIAVVTGAAQGLGATFAIALAEAGATVAVGDIACTAQTVAACSAHGGAAHGGTLDVTDPSSVAAFMAGIADNYGRLDILVNNAAVFASLKIKPFLEVDSAEWDKVLTVNVRGTFECIKAAVPLMQTQRYGKIINISSGTAIKGSPGLPHYVASKGAVISLTRAAAREFGDHGIRVNAIAPGLTMSDAVRNSDSWAGDIVTNNIASRAIKREALPDDLVGTLIFLASPASDFMTGQTLAVDGGSVMT